METKTMPITGEQPAVTPAEERRILDEQKAALAQQEAEEKYRLKMIKEQNKALEIDVRNLELKLKFHNLNSEYNTLIDGLRAEMAKNKAKEDKAVKTKKKE